MSSLTQIILMMELDHLAYHRPQFGGTPDKLCKLCAEKELTTEEKQMAVYDHLRADELLETEDYE